MSIVLFPTLPTLSLSVPKLLDPNILLFSSFSFPLSCLEMMQWTKFFLLQTFPVGISFHFIIIYNCIHQIVWILFYSSAKARNCFLRSLLCSECSHVTFGCEENRVGNSVVWSNEFAGCKCHQGPNGHDSNHKEHDQGMHHLWVATVSAKHPLTSILKLIHYAHSYCKIHS